MDKKELLSIFNDIEFGYEIQNLNSMCDRAKAFAINYLFDETDSKRYLWMYDIYCPNLTPIEQIFNVVYRQYINGFYKWCNVGDIPKQDMPLDIILNEELSSQKEVVYNDKKYIIDFVIDLTRKDKNGNYIYPLFSKLKYAIELDGYEYHTNKKQIANDYERENNLKEMGYRVIRFTGSQIYKEPYTCVDKLINIVLNDMRNEVK